MAAIQLSFVATVKMKTAQILNNRKFEFLVCQRYYKLHICRERTESLSGVGAVTKKVWV